MAMKCVAQIPKPVDVAETASQTWRIWPVDCADMVKQVDGCEGGQSADDGGEPDEPQIVGRGDAIIHFKHWTIRNA